MTHISESKPNIIMLGPDREVHGGISAVVNNLYDAGLGEKVNITYIPTMKEGSKLKKLIVAIKAYIKFCLVLKDADVVHVNVASDRSFERKAFFIKKAYKLSQKRIKKARSQDKAHKPKIIIHQHGGEWEKYYAALSPKRKNNVNKVFGMADEFLVLSPAYKNFFENMIGINDIDVFPDTIKIPAKPQKQYQGATILFLGRLCEAKGVRELINTVKEIHGIGPAYSCIRLILGGIWEDENLKTLIDDDCDYIEYAGWLSGNDKEKYLKECDIFALPSYFEGQSVAILEAMANACAIVATNVGGIPMMIEDGINGVLIKPKDEDGLLVAIKDLIDNKAKCKQYADAAYETVAKQFNIDETIAKLCEMYTS